MYKNDQKMLFSAMDETLKVLYVEDSAVVRESTHEMLGEFFSHIDTAKDGLEGLEKFEAFYKVHGAYYDIVIVDIKMPRMNGIDMSKSVLKFNPEQNIIIISAHSETDMLIKVIDLGISHFILKPIDINQLETVIDRVTSNIFNHKRASNNQEELKSMNTLLQLAKKEAEKSSKIKSDFLANMSHEIRTPLNAITGFISLLHEKENDPIKIKYMSMIKNASDALLDIISDILDISKIESGKLEISPVNFNPYDDLISIAELFQAKAAQKNILLKVQYNHTMPKSLYSDSLRIKQVLTNLLSNAIKFTPQNATVKCIIWYTKGRLNIRVKDYGIGIPEEKLKHIFDSFSQVDSSIVKEYGGTGLGLSISAELADLLGGELSVKSKEGVGSSFLFSLPIPLGKVSKEEETQTSLQTKKQNAHILLVEDIQTNQMFIGITLTNAGFTYEIANNGVEAVEKFKQSQYDLILMDENMPILSGTGATKEIRRIEKEQKLTHTPIISLTANALKGDKERFLAAGMDDYLSKPVEPKELVDVIRRFL